MRFSTRSKVGILLSLVTIIALLSTLMVTIISHGSPTRASSASTFQSSPGQAVKINSFKAPNAIAKPHNTMSQNLPKRNIGLRTLGHIDQSSLNFGNAPSVLSRSASPLDTNSGCLLQNFICLSNLSKAALNTFYTD